MLSGVKFQEALLPASLSPNACTGIQQPAMLESEDNSSLPGKVVFPGQGWVLVQKPFACVNTQTTKCLPPLWEEGQGPLHKRVEQMAR